MSYPYQELTEHQDHKEPVKECEYCQADETTKIQVQAWEIIQKAIREM